MARYGYANVWSDTAGESVTGLSAEGAPGSRRDGEHHPQNQCTGRPCSPGKTTAARADQCREGGEGGEGYSTARCRTTFALKNLAKGTPCLDPRPVTATG